MIISSRSRVKCGITLCHFWLIARTLRYVTKTTVLRQNSAVLTLRFHLKSSCSARKAHAQLCAADCRTWSGYEQHHLHRHHPNQHHHTVIILISIIMRSLGPVLPQPVNLSQSIETVLHTKGNPAHCTKQRRQKKLTGWTFKVGQKLFELLLEADPASFQT